MQLKKLIAPVLFAAAAVVGAGSLTWAEDKPADAAQMQLPPGWTPEDMQACMIAGMPGEQHKAMAREIGTWAGKNQMWMYEGAEPMKSDSVTTVSWLMEGRFLKVDSKGEMPGMGPFHGFAINGYDNVSGKFVSTWVDNMGTGLMNGIGELSPDGKTMTWNYTFNCPITKKAAVMREVETWTSDTTKTLEAWMTDPKSGKQYKMLQIDFTKQS